ncbi:MAG: bifunctional adenosylcobinamide kinase/adenosylcobinamide-phosphate guanylyltransferase [Candidatus Omnitrophica bacterium]|nr:bifunctional adenosylcobinamide kinase/adenosylcobinamide-phosphate guanylyltransferase [Candidatus Omnitrophota bacterium]
MNKIVLILGGARSGKSKLAVKLAGEECKDVTYIATAPACDDEMRLRIEQHKKTRPGTWKTIEIENDLIPHLKKITNSCDGVLIECMATYVSNLMMDGYKEKEIIKNIKELLARLKEINKKIFIVANEVGGGVVPETAAGREFRDIVGAVNQLLAQAANEVYLVTAGLPVRLK